MAAHLQFKTQIQDPVVRRHEPGIDATISVRARSASNKSSCFGDYHHHHSYNYYCIFYQHNISYHYLNATRATRHLFAHNAQGAPE